MKKVMITGIGMVTAVGNGRDASWESIKAGKPGIGKITKFDASRCTCQVAAEVKGFDEWAIGGGLLDKREARHMALFSQYAVATASGLKLVRVASFMPSQSDAKSAAFSGRMKLLWNSRSRRRSPELRNSVQIP